MIRPPGRRSSGKTACTLWSAPVRFTSSMARHAAGSGRASLPLMAMPALATRTSSPPPNVRAASAAARRIPSGSRTSATSGSARTPSARASRTASSNSARLARR